MATDLIERHVAAVLARLRSDQELTDSVYEGDVRDNPERYVNVWHDVGVFSQRSLRGEHQDVEITFTVHSVGTEMWQATWVDGRVLSLLNDWKPSVTGRRCWRLEPAGTQPIQKDTDVSPPKFFAVRRWVLRSVPARETP